MKKVLKSLGKTLAYLIGAVAIGVTPIVLINLLGTVPGIVVVFGLLASVLFYLIYKNEK